MNTFELELQSPVDAQSRIVSLEAPSEDVARQVVEEKERKLVDFSLMPPDRDTWEQGTYVVHDDDGNARVNLANWDAYHPAFAKHAAQLPYGEAVSAASRRLADLHNRMDVSPDGKVRYANLNARAVARVMAHRQAEPYAIVDVRKVDQVEIDALRLVSQVKAAIESDPRKWTLAIRKLREQGIPINAVTASLSGISVQKQMDGSNPWVWSSATIKCTLHNAYTFDPDTHDFFNDASSTELTTANGYTQGGNTLGSKTSTYDTATDQSRQDAADSSTAATTISATDSNIWVDTAGASSTDMLLGNIDFGATVSTTAGTFLITFDATGIIVVDVT